MEINTMVGGKIKTEEKENCVFPVSAHSLLLVLDCYFNNGKELSPPHCRMTGPAATLTYRT